MSTAALSPAAPEANASASLASTQAMPARLRGRRLSDQILAAFNQAYASGEREVAELMLDAIRKIEGGVPRRAGPSAAPGPDGQPLWGKVGAPERRSYSALRQAQLWIAFVDARNAYNLMTSDRSAEEAEAALAAMKAAYMTWSNALPQVSS